MALNRRQLLQYSSALGLASVAPRPAGAQATKPFRIGVLNDQSSVYASTGGKGSVYAVRLAVQDFGGQLLGRPIEIVSADHQNKVEIASGIAREWFDTKDVEAIFDLANSATALAVMGVASQANKVVVICSGVSSAISEKNCTPISFQWMQDTYANSRVQTRALVNQGKKKWFLLNPDYTFGQALETDFTSALTALGATVVGKQLVPLGGTDFSAAILAASQSGADVIQIGQNGADLRNLLKQIKEYGLDKKASISSNMNISDVINNGIEAMQGIFASESFYWDLNDDTRAWSKRYMAEMTIPANALQAGNYSGALHYFKAVAAVGNTAGLEVAKAMKATPVNDLMSKNLTILKNGRVARGYYQFKVKTAAQSKSKFDIYEVLAELPPEQIIRPISESECPLVKS